MVRRIETQPRKATPAPPKLATQVKSAAPKPATIVPHAATPASTVARPSPATRLAPSDHKLTQQQPTEANYRRPDIPSAQPSPSSRRPAAARIPAQVLEAKPASTKRPSQSILDEHPGDLVQGAATQAFSRPRGRLVTEADSAAGMRTPDAARRAQNARAARSPQLISDAASSGGYGTRYYTHRAAAESALHPGEKVGFLPGKGYYLYYPAIPLSALSPPAPAKLPRGPARQPFGRAREARSPQSAGPGLPPVHKTSTPSGIASASGEPRSWWVARERRAQRISVAERTAIFLGFFKRYPGAGNRGVGFGVGAMFFFGFETSTRRIANRGGSQWWEKVNGNMALDMRSALEDIRAGHRGQTRAIQAWIDYARSTTGGPDQQHLFWEAHQLSLHEGIRLAAIEYYKMSPTERAFANKAVEIVDQTALGNLPSVSANLFRNLLGGYSPGHSSATPADVNAITNLQTLSEALFILRPYPNIGINSTRWPNYA